MKIAYLIPGCGVSGGIAVICQHANRLLKRGHQVILVSETTEKSINWFPQQSVPILTLDEYPEDIEILVATGWSTSFAVVELPAKNKYYFVQSDETRFHDEESVWEYLTALSYHLNYNYLTEAQWIKKWLKENFNHQAELIPNGLDENIFFPDKPLRSKGKKPRILLEGAIALPYKGMREAFAAVENLDAEIWCISSLGKPKPEWHCDRFFNQVPMNKMRRIYSSCDILLKLSRVEGFFGPPLEMMACGGTVVVGKVSGYDEYIEDGINALVVEPGDIASAEAAIKRIISDANLRNKLILNGAITAKKWQWESSIDKLEAFFQKTLLINQNKSKSSVLEMANRGIALAYRLTKEQQNAHHLSEPQLMKDPLDKIFFHIRKLPWANKLARIIYKFYKKIKYLKAKLL